MTEQRRLLLTFLKENIDKQFSIEEIAEMVNVNNSREISVSAVYRNIGKFVSEGRVRRFTKEGSRKFVYQYISCNACENHLHMKCVKCSKILHMDDKTTEKMLIAAMADSNFKIDEKKTMLYGLCEDCNE